MARLPYLGQGPYRIPTKTETAGSGTTTNGVRATIGMSDRPTYTYERSDEFTETRTCIRPTADSRLFTLDR